MSFLDAKTFLLELLEQSVDGVLAVDMQGVVVVWNSALERMFGKPRASVIGQPLLEALAFLGDTGEDWSIREALSGKSCCTEEQPYFLPETGREGWYVAHYSPLMNPEGELVGALGIIRDVTEVRRKLDSSKAEAEQREEALRRQLRRRESPPASPALPVPPVERPVRPRKAPAPSALPPALDNWDLPFGPTRTPPAANVEAPPPVGAGPSEFGADAPIFDQDAALAYVGDPEVLDDLIQGFIVSLPEFVREMDHAVGRRDFAVALDHTIDVKKAVTALGAVRATRIATRLETVATEGKFEEVEKTWWRLRRELAVFRETLRTYRKAA